MTEPRPRSFIWLESNGHLFPQIWFAKPRVGCSSMKPVAERPLDPSEYALTLDQLVKKYPAPQQVSEHLVEMSKPAEGGAA